jgi:hypothetical protein
LVEFEVVVVTDDDANTALDPVPTNIAANVIAANVPLATFIRILLLLIKVASFWTSFRYSCGEGLFK